MPPLKRNVKVLVVDDSVFFREFLVKNLSKNEGIDVIGSAGDPFEAREKILSLRPDVLTLDIEMPKMNGKEFLKQMIPQYPLPVVVVSSVSGYVFEVLKAGAVDFVTKPGSNTSNGMNSFIDELVSKVKIAANVKQIGSRPVASLQSSAGGASAQKQNSQPVNRSNPSASAAVNARAAASSAYNNIVAGNPGSYRISGNTDKMIIALGASTGGTEATIEVIKDLPPETPGIVIVQHMPPVFTRLYAERLDKICKMRVKEAQTGDRASRGQVLIAPGDKHMRIRADANGYFVRCDAGEKVSGHCPSVDVLFESAAQFGGRNAVGIILTGMGTDGAKNLLEMRKAGAYTIGQDQQTCVVYGMPMVAYNLGGVCDQAPLGNIGGMLINYLNKRR